MSFRALYIDFNSFFASCEQKLQPELSGRPVGVVPMEGVDSTCCIAASYEAKAHGVRTGTNVAEARRMCPGIVFVEARHEAYIKLHHELVACVDRCAPVLKTLSIDEMVCELPPSWRNRAKAVSIAKEMKRRIEQEQGPALRSSIGIASNIFLAKMATELEKPDGLVALEESDLPNRLFELELSDICGIGKRMQRRLLMHGIRTVEELWGVSRDRLRRIWGNVEGARMYDRLRGVWLPPEETKRSSIGHSRVLPPEYRNEASARAMSHRLLEKAAFRLRGMNYCCAELALSLGYGQKRRWSRQVTFEETQSTTELSKALESLWNGKPQFDSKPLKISLTLLSLKPERHCAPSLFETEKDRRRTALDKAMDTINRKWGTTTAYYASSHEAVNAVPVRIAFNHIPDLVSGDLEEDAF